MMKQSKSGVKMNVGKQAAETAGILESSVQKVIRETKNVESGASVSFSTPHKERPRKYHKSTLDYFNENVVYSYQFLYLKKKDQP
ncbi:hypothetical protein C0J52_09776 [Blattella germanica]|nr:hypothetical protein C0J52_09776 [Blattella germanica]